MKKGKEEGGGGKSVKVGLNTTASKGESLGEWDRVAAMREQGRILQELKAQNCKAQGVQLELRCVYRQRGQDQRDRVVAEVEGNPVVA